jgi:hypothetical protein
VRNRLVGSLIVALVVIGAPAGAQVLVEGFDNITTLPGAGWFQANNSSPVGSTGWFQGNNTVFPAQAGAPTAYIGANFNNTAGTGTISNWLLTPELLMIDGDELKFWTRTVTTRQFPDRLQIRLSTAGASTNVGTTATDVGDFTTLLLDINPTYVAENYPNVWTEFTVAITGLPGGVANGRLAFRYFVENGGPNGANSDYIGIDTVSFDAAGIFLDGFESGDTTEWSAVQTLL